MENKISEEDLVLLSTHVPRWVADYDSNKKTGFSECYKGKIDEKIKLIFQYSTPKGIINLRCELYYINSFNDKPIVQFDRNYSAKEDPVGISKIYSQILHQREEDANSIMQVEYAKNLIKKLQEGNWTERLSG